MKRYRQLTTEQKTKAVEKCLVNLLEAILEGVKMLDDDLQSKIDEAVEKAEQMQTPWFALEYIMDTCAEELGVIALDEAKQCLYAQPGEYVIYAVAA